MQVLVRAAFFLWLTAVNLVALSSVWARIAEVFDSSASKRLFGFWWLSSYTQFQKCCEFVRSGQRKIHGTAAEAESWLDHVL